MWWLIFCVNLIETWVAQIKHYFWVWLWRCFQKWLTFELVDWVKWFFPPWSGSSSLWHPVPWHHPVHGGLESMKMWRKSKFTLSAWLPELRQWSSPILPSAVTQAFGLVLGFPLVDGRSLNFFCHNYMSQYLVIIYIYIYIYNYPVGYILLILLIWRTLSNTENMHLFTSFPRI